MPENHTDHSEYFRQNVFERLQKTTTQASLNIQILEIETRERNVEARERDVDKKYEECERNKEAGRQELDVSEEKTTQATLDIQIGEIEARKREIDKKYEECERKIEAERHEVDVLRKTNDQDISQTRIKVESTMARLRKDNERAIEERRSRIERDLKRLRAETEQDIKRRKSLARDACLKVEQHIASLRLALEKLRCEYDREKDIQRREFTIARQEFQLETETERATVAALRSEFERERDTAQAAIELRRRELDHNAQEQDREQGYLDAQAAKQNLREDSFVAEKSTVEASWHLKEQLLEKQASSLQKTQAELIQLHNELEAKKAKHQVEFKEWAVARAEQQEKMEEWIGNVKIENAKRRSELDARTAALTRQQKELEMRVASQRKRAKNLQTLTQPKSEKDEDNTLKPESRETTKPATSSNGNIEGDTTKTTNDSGTELKSRKAQSTGQSGVCGFVLLDSDSDDDIVNCPAEPEPGKQYRFDYQSNYNYMHSAESASEIQDRLFRQAAAKMKAQARVQVVSGSPPKVFQFSSPVLNIVERYPNHWKWKDPHSVLGLPPNAPLKLVKSQFRKLARTYHPDKSKAPDSGDKFHSISAAYHKIAQHE